MKIALASPRFPSSLQEGILITETLVRDAANRGAIVICFPETFLPGYPLSDFRSEKVTDEQLRAALDSICAIAKENHIAVIMPMDWYQNGVCYNLAQVISADGEVLGYQTKNQLDPSEDQAWTPGNRRSLFEAGGLRFAITICHEGFRYPESVRWAAREGAQVVFHPHFSGSDQTGVQLTAWQQPGSPYYEKAVMMRALENTIYMASVGYATKFQESATSVIAPNGDCLAYQPYGKEGVLVVDIEPAKATGLLAARFKPELYNYGETRTENSLRD